MVLWEGYQGGSRVYHPEYLGLRTFVLGRSRDPVSVRVLTFVGKHGTPIPAKIFFVNIGETSCIDLLIKQG